MDYDQFLTLVKSRRSIRRFKSDPVSDEMIDKIIEAARWAPSGFNLQPWEFVIVKDQKLKDEMVRICRESIASYGDMEKTREEWQGGGGAPRHAPSSDAPGGDFSAAPVYILCCGDTRTNAGLPMARRYSAPLKEEAFKGGLASAFLYMHLAATALGLASQWVSAVCGPYAQCMIKNLLGIPLEIEIYDMMALGHGAMGPMERLIRDKNEMVHYDRSPESYRTDQQVREFIRKIRTGR